MQPDDSLDFEHKMRMRYLSYLADQSQLLGALLAKLKSGILDPGEIADLKTRAHKMFGNGTSFGFPAISRAAMDLEDLLSEQQEASPDLLRFHIDRLLEACSDALKPQAAAEPDPNPVTERPVAPAEPATAPAARQPRVLIVDDDPLVRDALADMLSEVADISTASDAGNALAKMLQNRPDLLLLDDRMPGAFSGLELQAKLKTIESLSSVPVIMITASDKSDSVMRALTAGAVDYIMKPFDRAATGKRLRTRVQRMTKSVFIVDDDRIICEMLTRKFTAAGYSVTVFGDGLSALDAIVETPPSLVVLDTMLPGLNGNQILQKIRQIAGLGDLPVVVLSARRQERDIVGSFDLGATDYIVKPFNPQELVARCVRLLETQVRGAT